MSFNLMCMSQNYFIYITTYNFFSCICHTQNSNIFQLKSVLKINKLNSLIYK